VVVNAHPDSGGMRPTPTQAVESGLTDHLAVEHRHDVQRLRALALEPFARVLRPLIWHPERSRPEARHVHQPRDRLEIVDARCTYRQARRSDTPSGCIV